MAGRHRRRDIPPDVRPTETRPDGSWLPADWLARAEGGAEAREELRSAFWGAVDDWEDDRVLSNASRERLARAGRTLLQGALAAAVLGAVPTVWTAVQGGDVDGRALVLSAGQAALAAVIAYLHPRRPR